MALSSYVAYSSVRAALGVSDEELPDSVLSESIYEDNLLLELDEVGATAASDLLSFIASTPTGAAELKYLRTGRLFATYAVANQLLSSLPLFSPKEITDGKASVVRYADGPYKKTIEEVRARYEKYAALIGEAYSDLIAGPTPVTTVPTFLVLAGMVDPVTGE